jgi:hypothetical protein
MSLFESASLVVTPNGAKASKLYAIKPTSGAGDLSVTRATTATRVNSAGLIESVASNVPRLDYTNGSCPSILVEPQRTNICLNSNDLNSGSYINQSNATLTRITSGSPSGGAFDRLVTGGSPGTVGSAGRYLQVGVNSGANATYSIYLKGTGIVFLNMFNGISVSSANITLTNTWTRYELTSTGGSGIYIDWSIWMRSGGDIVDIAFQQVELGSYATSYIPTTSASVTRNADVISKTGISSLIGQTEGTLFVDFYAPIGYDGDNLLFMISDNTELNLMFINRNNGRATFAIVSSGSVQLSYMQPTVLPTGRHKVAFAYKQNDFAVYLDGVLIHSDTSGSVPACNKLNLGCYVNNGLQYNAGINLNALWKTRLTNAELAELTTI